MEKLLHAQPGSFFWEYALTRSNQLMMYCFILLGGIMVLMHAGFAFLDFIAYFFIGFTVAYGVDFFPAQKH